jgi:hypothetical protein
MKRTTPPPGGRVVRPQRSDLEPFYKFEEEGEVLEGLLVATKAIKGQDRYLLEADNGMIWVLPGHYKLMELLAECAIGDRVWIQYEGEQELEGRSQPMKLYNLVVYSNEERTGLAKDPVHKMDEPGDNTVPC